MTTATNLDLESRIAALEQKVADLQAQLENDRVAARIRQGLAAADVGQVRPAREVLEELRIKHNIPSL